eukprot:6645755-Lingulodinium_polyedra.AAC.1
MRQPNTAAPIPPKRPPLAATTGLGPCRRLANAAAKSPRYNCDPATALSRHFVIRNATRPLPCHDGMPR